MKTAANGYFGGLCSSPSKIAVGSSFTQESGDMKKHLLRDAFSLEPPTYAPREF
jgi:hypothetical protein